MLHPVRSRKIPRLENKQEKTHFLRKNLMATRLKCFLMMWRFTGGYHLLDAAKNLFPSTFMIPTPRCYALVK
ncbi:MAG: hypothetical protein DRI91_06070 [Aquificota bacterium]|nr:MAG: hypothetical protein DRI91_06070 [Aquificota bacterium]